MKRYMDYEEFKGYCVSMAARVQQNDILIAVSRGGISAAHIVAKITGKPLYYYFPADNLIAPFLMSRDVNNLFFIEDLIAQGRTFNKVKSYCNQLGFLSWSFNAVLIDPWAGQISFDNKEIHYELVSDDWIVFPYEEMDKMKEGDRGLFREGTDSYGK